MGRAPASWELEHTRKKGSAALLVLARKKVSFGWWEGKKVETQPPTHALETNMEACADAEEGKKGTSASFFLIG